MTPAMRARHQRRRAALGAACWLLSVVALTLAAWAAVLVTRKAWPLGAAPHQTRSQVSAEALLLESLLVVVAAPLAGVAFALQGLDADHLVHHNARGHSAFGSTCRIAVPLAAGSVTLAMTSAIAAWVVLGESADSHWAIVRSHVALGLVSLAVAAVGSFSASLAADPLDAAAWALLLSVLSAVGVLAAGPGIAEVPTSAINAALQASPVVAIASAADFDLLRTDLVYRVSPLAHLRTDYPTWLGTSALYGGLALALFLALSRTVDRRMRSRLLERTTT